MTKNIKISIIPYFVFVDDHTKLSKQAVGKAGSTQRGEQLLDGLLCPLPHTPALRQQNCNCGTMVHPVEQVYTVQNIWISK